MAVAKIELHAYEMQKIMLAVFVAVAVTVAVVAVVSCDVIRVSN